MSKIDYREHIQKDLDYYAIHSHKNTRPLSKMDGHSFAKILTKMTLIRLGLLNSMCIYYACFFLRPETMKQLMSRETIYNTMVRYSTAW